MATWKKLFSFLSSRPHARLAAKRPGVGGDKSWSYKALVDHMASGFAYLEMVTGSTGEVIDCRYLFVNRAFETIIGLKSAQVVGKTIREVKSGIEPGWIGFLGRVSSTGEPTTQEWFVPQSGRHYIAHAFSIQNGCCAITFEDVTERTQAEEKMRQAFGRLSSIAEFSMDIIFRVDMDGIVQYVSPAVVPILGYSPEEVVGRKFLDFILTEDLPAVQDARDSVASGHSIRAREFRVRRQDGKIIFIEVSAAPLIVAGKVVGEQGTVRDITERKKVEEALRQRTIELELERQNLQTIFNSAQVGMLLIDRHGIIRRVNEVAARLVNKSPSGFLGRRPGEAFCCIHVVEEGRTCGEASACEDCSLYRTFKTVLETGRSLPPTEISREFVINGERRTVWLEIGAARVSVSGGEDVLLSVADITDRKQIEVSLQQSEKRLGDIVNAFPLPFYCKDMEGRYRIFNREFADFLGFPTDKILNATVYELLPKDLADIYYVRDNDLLAHPGSQVFEAPYRLPDGTTRDVVFFKRTLHDDAGRLQGVVGTILDITERKKTEERVKDSERRLQEFLNAVPVPMFLKNTDGVYVLCNQAFADFNGVQPKDIIGKTARHIVSDSFAEQMIRQDDSILHGGQPSVSEIRTVHPDGVLRDVVVYKTVHYDAQGKIVGIIGAFIDFTERKKAAEEVRRRGEELKFALAELQAAHDQLQKTQDKMLQAEKLAAIGLLAAGVAHEVNNPLGFIGSNLSTLEGYVRNLKEYFIALKPLCHAVEEGDLERARREFRDIDEQRKELDVEGILEDLSPLMNETRDGFERIRKIVFELRIFSRTDQGEEKPVDINAVIEGVLRIIGNEIKYKAELCKELGRIPLVKGNSQQLSQVFMNILVNANQAIPEHGKISIRTFRKAPDIVVEIEDTGAGIPPEIMGKIFDPFFTTKAPGEGTGLGLSVSYDIIKRHGGSIGAESEAGKGTKFIVTLPIMESAGG